MTSARVEKLLEFLKTSPDDPFNYYALALEFSSVAPETAVTYFEKLLYDFPDYLPTYYQAGIFFIDQHDTDRAKTVITKGMPIALAQGNVKTLNELKNLLANLD